jgi:type IV secretion system protein VirB1
MSINVDTTPALIQRCAPDVAPQTISAVIKTESGGNSLAININYKKGRLARRPRDLTEAIGWSKWLIQNGYNIDMGLMQINSKNLAKFGTSVEQIFDPCTNIYVGSQILTQNYLRAKDKYGQGQNALFASLSAYNTGHFQRGLQNGYVNRVVKNANKPVIIKSAENTPLTHPPIRMIQTAQQHAHTHHHTHKKHVVTTNYHQISRTQVASEKEIERKKAIALAYDAPTAINMKPR